MIVETGATSNIIIVLIVSLSDVYAIICKVKCAEMDLNAFRKKVIYCFGILC